MQEASASRQNQRRRWHAKGKPYVRGRLRSSVVSLTRGTAATVQAYATALNQRDVEVLSGLIASDVLGHEPTDEIVGFDAFKSNIERWLCNYDDLQISTEDLLVARDRAAWRWRLDGTHRPTGRRITVGGILIFRVERGRIAEYWGHYDRLGMLEQQGVSH